MTNNIDECQKRITQLEEIVKKLNPKMNTFSSDYQINIKFKTIQAKMELYQIYTDSKMTEMHGFSSNIPPILDAEFCFKKIDEFLEELNNL